MPDETPRGLVTEIDLGPAPSFPIGARIFFTLILAGGACMSVWILMMLWHLIKRILHLPS